MSANQARFRIATMARVLGVSPSGYHAWRRRGPSARAQADADLTVRVSAIHAYSRGTYGAPRIHAELIEGWYNTRRRHSALGYLSPLDFEHLRETAPADGGRSGEALAPAVRFASGAPAPAGVVTGVAAGHTGRA